MSFLNCPKSEALLEFITIPTEISVWQRFSVKLHASRCAGCREKIQSIQRKWQEYFAPEPDITSSLMSVYSRLQNDETLILKGWKLSEFPSKKRTFIRSVESWAMRGVVSLSLASLLGFALFTEFHSSVKTPIAPQANTASNVDVPLAQFRVQDKNSVRVQYLQPELIQSIEFETRGGR